MDWNAGHIFKGILGLQTDSSSQSIVNKIRESTLLLFSFQNEKLSAEAPKIRNKNEGLSLCVLDSDYDVFFFHPRFSLFKGLGL